MFLPAADEGARNEGYEAMVACAQKCPVAWAALQEAAVKTFSGVGEDTPHLRSTLLWLTRRGILQAARRGM